MKTNQDYTFNYKVANSDYGIITVPKGTKLTHLTAMGIDIQYHFVSDFEWIKQTYPEIDRALLHDAEHYGINVPVEFVDKEIIDLVSFNLLPLSSQLYRYTGQHYTSGDFVNYGRSGLSAENGNIIMHVSSGALFRVPMDHPKHDFRFNAIDEYFSMGIDKDGAYVLYNTHYKNSIGKPEQFHEPVAVKHWDLPPSSSEISNEIHLNDSDRWRNSDFTESSEHIEVSEYVYDTMLNSLPPRNWNGNYFEVGEPSFHDSNGRPIHRAFYKKGERYFTRYPKF